MIEFLNGGILTTVQDDGRRAFQRYGMSVAGAMDKFSFVLSNVIVGNRKRNTAVLEVTYAGPHIQFHRTNIFAVCGADFSATLDGVPIENNRAYIASEGSILRMGAAKNGCRGYIAFHGGLDIDKVMGSRSTFIKGQIGGLEGRAVKKGDRIGFVDPSTALPNLEYRFFGHDFGMHPSCNQVIRVIEGPQADYFSPVGMARFLSSEYEVTHESDRMGYRLAGEPISHAHGKNGDIISDGIPLGAIQVPKDQPIIMMADRQTTGGYTKIASVISADLPYVAQLRAGDKIHFKMVSIEEAQDLYIKRMQFFQRLFRQLNEAKIIDRHIYKIKAGSESFDIALSEKL